MCSAELSYQDRGHNPNQLSISSITTQRWRLIKLALQMVRPIGVVCLFFALVVMLGYIIDNPALYRPISGGPATNPLTALCMLLIATGLCLYRVFTHVAAQRLLGWATLVLTAGHMLDLVHDMGITTLITPFSDSVSAELAQGMSNAMGSNSSFMLASLAIALIFYSHNKPVVSQSFAFIGLAFPMLSWTGYAYQIENFYGQMSLTTTSVGFILSVGTLALSAHRGALRAILSPYIGGRLARIQVMLGYLVPFLLGWLTINTLDSNNIANEFGLFVILMSWFIIVLVCFSAVVQERVDLRRRTVERSLSFAAMHDPLTRLPNRRRFFDVASREMERALRTRHEAWVLMLDLDYFKRINDTAGHAMGDLVLMQFAALLSQSVRTTDLAARLGGEEFAILLTDSSASGVSRVVDIIHTGLKALNIPGWTDNQGPVTVSIGCASIRGKKSVKDVLLAADTMLYQAKADGRNQTVMEEPPVSLIKDTAS